MAKKKCACGCCVSPRIINRVVLVLDESGSMHRIAKKTLSVVDEWIQNFKEQNRKFNQDTYLTVVKFGSKVKTLFSNAMIDVVYSPIQDYHPGSGGNTALYDGVMDGIRNVEDKANESVLVIVVTDGEENWSKMNSGTTSTQLGERMHSLERTGRWTFTFAMPDYCVEPFKRLFPFISNDNIQAWENTEEGMNNLREVTASGITRYYGARSVGQTQVKSFYTDLSGVTPGKLKQNLDDITHECEVFDVNKEDNISHFVELKKKSPYIKGEAFYQLMKKEKVGARKQICIMDKKSGHIYGGAKARQLIGLQNGVDAKVDPFNHGGFEIFIESRSTNRILPRGTKILIRKYYIV